MCVGETQTSVKYKLTHLGFPGIPYSVEEPGDLLKLYDSMRKERCLRNNINYGAINIYI